MTFNNKMGLGMMRFPSSQGYISNFIKEALSLGVTYIESCNFYIDYKCEELIGNALISIPRNSYELAAKCCYKNELENLDFNNFFEQQLKTLKVDYFDYYLFQAVDRYSFISEIEIKQKFDEIYNILKQKQKEGKVKYIGFSFHDTSIYLEYLLKNFKWDFCQLSLNYYDWYLGYGKELYLLTEKYNIPVFVMGALKGGLLGDKNNINPRYAYDFLNLLPNVKLILNGSSDINQMYLNNQIINNPRPITNQDLGFIKRFLKNDIFIPCTGCNYCKNKCSINLNISEIFQSYNNAIQNNNTKNYLEEIKINNNQSLKCIYCKNCEKYCPQHLSISNLMKEKIFPLRL